MMPILESGYNGTTQSKSKVSFSDQACLSQFCSFDFMNSFTFEPAIGIADLAHAKFDMAASGKLVPQLVELELYYGLIDNQTYNSLCFGPENELSVLVNHLVSFDSLISCFESIKVWFAYSQSAI